MVALINSTYKTVLCFVRHLNHNINSSFNPDKIGAPLAGFLSGLWIGLDDQDRRQILTILLVSRVSDTLLNLLVSKLPQD